jgi:hypothetical protein
MLNKRDGSQTTFFYENPFCSEAELSSAFLCCGLMSLSDFFLPLFEHISAAYGMKHNFVRKDDDGSGWKVSPCAQHRPIVEDFAVEFMVVA